LIRSAASRLALGEAKGPFKESLSAAVAFQHGSTQSKSRKWSKSLVEMKFSALLVVPNPSAQELQLHPSAAEHRTCRSGALSLLCSSLSTPVLTQLSGGVVFHFVVSCSEGRTPISFRSIASKLFGVAGLFCSKGRFGRLFAVCGSALGLTKARLAKDCARPGIELGLGVQLAVSLLF
jgi:hypothetical protein